MSVYPENTLKTPMDTQIHEHTRAPFFCALWVLSHGPRTGNARLTVCELLTASPDYLDSARRALPLMSFSDAEKKHAQQHTQQHTQRSRTSPPAHTTTHATQTHLTHFQKKNTHTHTHTFLTLSEADTRKSDAPHALSEKRLFFFKG